MQQIKREVVHNLTHREIFDIVRAYASTHADVMKVLIEHPKGYCPFLDECKYFPCETLHCNCDVLNNGYPIRWS